MKVRVNGDLVRFNISRKVSLLSPAFLADAVRKLDHVFGELRYPDVTAPAPLLVDEAVNG